MLADFVLVGLSCLVLGMGVGGVLERREWTKHRLQDEVDKRITHLLRTEYTIEVLEPILSPYSDDIRPTRH